MAGHRGRRRRDRGGDPLPAEPGRHRHRGSTPAQELSRPDRRETGGRRRVELSPSRWIAPARTGRELNSSRWIAPARTGRELSPSRWIAPRGRDGIRSWQLAGQGAHRVPGWQDDRLRAEGLLEFSGERAAPGGDLEDVLVEP